MNERHVWIHLAPHCGEKIDAQTLKCRISQKWETSDCLGFDYEDLGALGYYYHLQLFFQTKCKNLYDATNSLASEKL
jgi:hypothetical protein